MTSKTDPLPQRVIEYQATAPSNPYATPALIVGLVGIAIPFVGAIAAIFLGRRALHVARGSVEAPGRAVAKTAIALGVLGLVFWCIAGAAAVPAIRNARRQAETVACLSNLRQLAMAVNMYAVQNKGYVPEDLDQLVASGVPAMGSAYICPACASNPAKPVATTGRLGKYSYIYVGGGRKIPSVRSPANTPLIYEPLTNHDGRSINVAYFDGHAEVLTGAQAATFLSTLAALTPSTAPATTQSVQSETPPRAPR
jgi:prepilin-type processing-associated H-X9-DG protein